MAEQIAALQDGIEAMSADLDRIARRSARSARGTAWNLFGEAQDTLGDGYEIARENAIDAARYGRRMVRRHPVPAAALAAGVGLVLIGLLVSMSNDRD